MTRTRAPSFVRTNTSLSYSTLFGLAAVATGGYHFAMCEADRFKGEMDTALGEGAERSTKRKTSRGPLGGRARAPVMRKRSGAGFEPFALSRLEIPAFPWPTDA